jgi:hypothetical protein
MVKLTIKTVQNKVSGSSTLSSFRRHSQLGALQRILAPSITDGIAVVLRSSK